MPYQLHVLIENRVSLQAGVGHFSKDDMLDSAANMAKFFDSLTEANGIQMLDFNKLSSIHNNLLEVRQLAQPWLSHPKLTMAVGYGMGDRAVVNFLANTLGTFFKVPARIFRHEAEAVQFIISKYPDLAHSLPEALQGYHAQDA